jgi:rubrerythrin
MHDFLRDCRKIETAAGSIYQHLSAEISYPQEIRSLFQRLSSEEREHARQIDLALQATPAELDAVARFSGARLNASLLLVDHVLEMLQSRQLSEIEALRLAVELENKFVNVHVHNSLDFGNPQLAKLFSDLGSYDQCHVDQLQACLARWEQTVKS